MTHISQLIMVKSPREGLFFSLAFGVCDVEEKRRINEVTARFSRPERVADHFQHHGQLRGRLRTGLSVSAAASASAPLSPLPRFSNKGQDVGGEEKCTTRTITRINFSRMFTRWKRTLKKERKKRNAAALAPAVQPAAGLWRDAAAGGGLAIHIQSLAI